jgi:putative redox protein
MQGRLNVARVQADLGDADYRVDISAGGHALVADEPLARGGGDAGPAPYDLLLASLSACTAITLKMYAARKAWPLSGLHLDLRYTSDGPKVRIERAITVAGDLTQEQRARLAEIAERTPVTLTLKSGLEIRTDLH